MTRDLPVVNHPSDPAQPPSSDSHSHGSFAPGVRLALPIEAGQIAEIQRREWSDHDRLSSMLGELTLDEMSEIWRAAIVTPPMAHHRVLVATEPEGAPLATGTAGETKLAARVVGYAAVQPCADDDAAARDGELAGFRVDEMARGRGHTSRLMNAAVDTMRADGYQRAVCWVTSDDDDFRALLTECGWGPDGSHRELGNDDGSVTLKQVRLHTGIGDPAEPTDHA